jgi:hypothetical protein
MTKERLEKYFELLFELNERGRLDPVDNNPEPMFRKTPRFDEYLTLLEEYDAWEPKPMANSIEMRLNRSIETRLEQLEEHRDQHREWLLKLSEQLGRVGIPG